MRKILAFIFIYISFLSFAQGTNRFADPEENQFKSSNSPYEQAAAEPNPKADCNGDGVVNNLDKECRGNNPNPGDPVPIDDYIPLLVIIAAGMIVYHTYRKKQVS